MTEGGSAGLKNLDTMCINTIRTLAMDAIQKANSGHPGAPMGMADIAEVLWNDYLKHNPGNPHWADRDRFVLSAGHGSMLLYSLLYLTGTPEMTLDQIKAFRQWGSKTAGHPERGLAPGVEITTGPLGQGCAASVGMALAEVTYDPADKPVDARIQGSVTQPNLFGVTDPYGRGSVLDADDDTIYTYQCGRFRPEDQSDWEDRGIEEAGQELAGRVPGEVPARR